MEYAENIFNEVNVQIIDEIASWKDAIRVCAQPLLDNDYIVKDYIDVMINVAEELGPFFDFGKGVALPHSRPENGVKKKGVSLLKVNKPVYLLDLQEHPIEIFIVLAAEDNSTHLDILGLLADTLIDDDKVEAIKKATTKKEIINIFKKETE